MLVNAGPVLIALLTGMLEDATAPVQRDGERQPAADRRGESSGGRPAHKALAMRAAASRQRSSVGTRARRA